MWGAALTLATRLLQARAAPASALPAPRALLHPRPSPHDLQPEPSLFTPRRARGEPEGDRKRGEIQKNRRTEGREANAQAPGGDSRLSPGAVRRPQGSTNRNARARFRGFEPQSKSLVSLQCQTQAELLTPPSPGPRVSSRIQPGTEGRYQASQPAHHSASAAGPTAVTRARTPIPGSSGWPEAPVGSR